MKAMLTSLVLGALVGSALGQSTIHPSHRYAWGANLGWLDWRGDGAQGARIGFYVCSGYLYAANAGWIHLGNGLPANGIRYQNTAASGDYGVNHDGLGNLRGYAWGANVGWIRFEDLGQPRIDLGTGQLTGYAYAANAGWISLSSTLAFVQTDALAPAVDTDGDGLADAYELTWMRDLTPMHAASDQDGDGTSDREEYWADTNPVDAADQLRITALLVLNRGEEAVLTWTSRPTRQYRIWMRADLDPNSAWSDSVLGAQWPDPGVTTTRSVPGSPEAQRLYRIQVLLPLSP